MRYNLRKRPEYRFCMKDLSAAGHIRRLVAERDIHRNPNHRLDRMDVYRGGRWIVLQITAGLAVYFHRLDGADVSLDLVHETDPLPDWLIRQAGTWYEHLDLT